MDEPRDQVTRRDVDPSFLLSDQLEHLDARVIAQARVINRLGAVLESTVVVLEALLTELEQTQDAVRRGTSPAVRADEHAQLHLALERLTRQLQAAKRLP